MASGIPAGWYDDAGDAMRLRYWDGDAWTQSFALKTGPSPAAPLPPASAWTAAAAAARAAPHTDQAPQAAPSAGFAPADPASAPPLAGDSNGALVAQVQGARFQPVKFRPGYDMADVDGFLDDLVEALRAGRPVRELIDGSRFAQTKFREGYDISDVDAFLDRIRAAASA